MAISHVDYKGTCLAAMRPGAAILFLRLRTSHLLWRLYFHKESLSIPCNVLEKAEEM